MITENLFEARFRFVNEIVRLGADVRTDGHHALVRGKLGLSGAPVEAADIRAGAGLVLAGLAAQGYTTVYEIHHVERGTPGSSPTWSASVPRSSAWTCPARSTTDPRPPSERALRGRCTAPTLPGSNLGR